MLIPYQRHPYITDDGWELVLYRSPPPTGGDRWGRPVLLIPGMNANRFGFGLHPGTSLPGALNAGGRDVWIVELRGSASSTYRGGGRAPIDLDRKLALDLPAAIEATRVHTGADAVDLVGHSLGGLFAYLLMGAPSPPPVGRAVTLCAPGTLGGLLGWRRRILGLPLRALAPALRRLPGFGVPRLARRRGPLPRLVALRRHFAPGAVDRGTLRAWLDHAVEDLPGGDLAQILRWVATGRLTSQGGDDYAERLGAVEQPTLVIASAYDRVVPPVIVRHGFDQLGARAKRYLVIGRDHGASRDYGHAGLLVSQAAKRDVFRPVVTWLCRHEAGASAPV